MKENDLLTINNLIKHYDPMDLLAIGAPSDEYADESAKVLAAYYASDGVVDFKKSFVNIFTNNFGLDKSDDKYRNLDKIAEMVYLEMRKR